MLVKLTGFWIVSFYRFRDRAQFLQQTLYGPLKLDSGSIAAQFLQLAVGLAEQQTSLLRLPRLHMQLCHFHLPLGGCAQCLIQGGHTGDCGIEMLSVGLQLDRVTLQ